MQTQQRKIVIWEGIALAVVLLLALALRIVNLDANGYGNMYYAAAARSMSLTWHAFFYGALDPSGYITVDKPPFALWMQSLSVRLFGFSGLSLLLPQAVAGTVSVGLLWHLVRRHFGAIAGLIAALLLTITPIAVAVDRSNVLDSWLTLALLLTSLAAVRAAETGRWTPLLLAAFWIGIGFNIKMLAALALIPVLGVVWFWGIHRLQMPVGKRLTQMAAAAMTLVLVSFSWTMIVDSTPPERRPYIGGSSNNTVRDLAFGYNGIGRIAGQGPGGGPGGGMPPMRGGQGGFRPGGPGMGMPPGPSPMMGSMGMPPLPPGMGQAPGNGGGPGPGMGPGGPGGMGPGGIMFGGTPGPGRLFAPGMAEQILFLLPLGLAGLVLPLLRRSDREQDASNLTLGVLGGWLLLYGVLFSFARGIFHPYYLVVLAPPLAGLGGIAAATLINGSSERSGMRSALSLLVAGLTAGFQVFLLYQSKNVSAQYSLVPAVIAGGLLIAGVSFAPSPFAVSSLPLRSLLSALWCLGFAGLVSPSAYWSIATATHPSDGNIPMATVQSQAPLSDIPWMKNQRGSARRFAGPMSSHISDEDRKLAAYLIAHQGKARYLLVASSSMEASSLIVLTGKPIMVLGGFGGGDQTMTLAEFKKRVASGEVRYVLVGGGGPPGMGGMGPMGGGPGGGMPPMGGGGPGGPGMGAGNREIFQWVREHGSPVNWKQEEPAEEDEEDFPFPMPGGPRGRQVYEVTPGD